MILHKPTWEANMDTEILQIIIMVAGFALTIIIGLLRFPSRDESVV